MELKYKKQMLMNKNMKKIIKKVTKMELQQTAQILIQNKLGLQVWINLVEFQQKKQNLMNKIMKMNK